MVCNKRLLWVKGRIACNFSDLFILNTSKVASLSRRSHQLAAAVETTAGEKSGVFVTSQRALFFHFLRNGAEIKAGVVEFTDEIVRKV